MPNIGLYPDRDWVVPPYVFSNRLDPEYGFETLHFSCCLNHIIISFQINISTLFSDGNAVERICLSTAEVTNTWPLDALPPSAGGSVEAIHAAEDERSLHLAFSSGVYCRLDLSAEGAVSTGVHTCNLSNDEAGITSNWRWQFAKSQDKEKSGGLFLFGVSSQGRTIVIF
jgi:hypothetical protein